MIRNITSTVFSLTSVYSYVYVWLIHWECYWLRIRFYSRILCSWTCFELMFIMVYYFNEDMILIKDKVMHSIRFVVVVVAFEKVLQRYLVQILAVCIGWGVNTYIILLVFKILQMMHLDEILVKLQRNYHNEDMKYKSNEFH